MWRKGDGRDFTRARRAIARFPASLFEGDAANLRRAKRAVNFVYSNGFRGPAAPLGAGAMSYSASNVPAGGVGGTVTA